MNIPTLPPSKENILTARNLAGINPQGKEAQESVMKGRKTISGIFDGSDSRFFAAVGPCGIKLDMRIDDMGNEIYALQDFCDQ